MPATPFHFDHRCFWIMLLAVGSLHAERDGIDTVGKAAGDWIKVRTETTRIQSEWSNQHQLLESMVGGMTERAKTLEAKRDFLLAKTAKDRDELEKMAADNKGVTADLQAMDAQLQLIDKGLVDLRPSLPPRLADALDLSYRSLARPELTVSERMQLTMTVLNRCAQFNRGISCDEEVLDPDGAGKARLIEVIYWGLSHGYALDHATGQTWFGSPGATGWHWEPLPDATKQVTALVAIYRGKQEPGFVSIPARMKHTGNTAAQQ